MYFCVFILMQGLYWKSPVNNWCPVLHESSGKRGGNVYILAALWCRYKLTEILKECFYHSFFTRFSLLMFSNQVIFPWLVPLIIWLKFVYMEFTAVSSFFCFARQEKISTWTSLFWQPAHRYSSTKTVMKRLLRLSAYR